MSVTVAGIVGAVLYVSGFATGYALRWLLEVKRDR